MDATAPLKQQAPGPAPGPVRRRFWYLGCALVAGILIALFARWATDIRQSGVRASIHSTLRAVAQAAGAYQQQFNTSPTLDDLFKAGFLDAASLRRFSRCAPLTATQTIAPTPPSAAIPMSATPTPSFDAWLIQTTPCRAVRKGDAWGGPGETIDHDLPACRFILMRDWSVRQVDEPDYQRDIAPLVRLTPLP